MKPHCTAKEQEIEASVRLTRAQQHHMKRGKGIVVLDPVQKRYVVRYQQEDARERYYHQTVPDEAVTMGQCECRSNRPARSLTAIPTGNSSADVSCPGSR